ncbi:uncharacterized protein BCR38DRAFT_484689 [Pseudomassariella vexata]|uniref:J domain-containing protein n=1 Tax=Pseudomassariella vexata TaxID=1141098 RepID=A0A1Y2E1L9_9PEZI|nr:uncharacterized protein BCR38DRAFT_484689 [Pseudomassariella vexata]ORY65244.1 hypothetical protein BCR38DRAFT_484689 [Pseudomassariella vexata]
MPKLDISRNYYADLEISPNASGEEIKRQFRKLALKYHPDRNPGREAEVNSKFQIIQSAHEILTDETLKRKYDDSIRHRGPKYPTSSGVKGNPWQNVAKDFPVPPRRAAASTGAQPKPASGAHRYSGFTNGVPRPAKPAPKEDPESRKANYKAWEDMRPSSRGRTNPPPVPNRPVPGRPPTSAARDARTSDSESFPRTASQRQKAQASFGNATRRSGFTPRSPGLGDEPPVTNNNYFTTRTHTNIFNEQSAASVRKNRRASGTSATADPLAQFRKDNFMDERQSTPYHTPGGEKTSLFDEGSGLGRTRSTREPPRKSGAEGPATGTFPFPRQRQRSSSTPRSSSNDGGSEDSTKVNTGADDIRRSSNGGDPSSSRASDRYKPKADSSNTTAAGKRATTAGGNNSFLPEGNTAQPDGGPSVYAPPFISSQRHFSFAGLQPHNSGSVGWSSKLSFAHYNGASSGTAKKSDYSTLYPLENLLKKNAEHMVNKKPYVTREKDIFKLVNEAEKMAGCHTTQGGIRTDNCDSNSFSFSADDNASEQMQSPHNFASSSADNINTRFVQDEHPDEWEFKAGNASANEPFTPSKSRSQSRSRLNHRSPARTTPRPQPTTRMSSTQEGSEDAIKAGFSAGEWSEKIGPHHFIPQPSYSASTSPTRRAPSRKNSKPVKMTMGTAGLVDDESSSAGEGWQEIPRPPSGTDSPNAMDIDTPPSEKTEDTPKASQANGVRNIHVEPSRPEWRAGNAQVDGATYPRPARPNLDGDSTILSSHGLGAKTDSGSAIANPFISQTGGSEDTEEFRTTFADFKKVEPFTDSTPTGLKSFADLKSTLPFESKSSEQIPLDTQIPVAPLSFPTPPVAPRLPATMAVAGIRPNLSSFRKYAVDFYNYMDKWEAFNQKVLDHFTARQTNYKKRRQQNGLSWLDSAVVADAARMYQLELDQDHDVRKQWNTACENHQTRIREFLAFKERVK